MLFLWTSFRFVCGIDSLNRLSVGCGTTPRRQVEGLKSAATWRSLGKRGYAWKRFESRHGPIRFAASAPQIASAHMESLLRDSIVASCCRKQHVAPAWLIHTYGTLASLRLKKLRGWRVLPPHGAWLIETSVGQICRLGWSVDPIWCPFNPLHRTHGGTLINRCIIVDI